MVSRLYLLVVCYCLLYVCYVVRDNVGDIVLFDILHDIVFFCYMVLYMMLFLVAFCCPFLLVCDLAVKFACAWWTL